jgi:hypothetical protein
MNVSAVHSPPFTPPTSSPALVQAGKVENNAVNGLQAASSYVIPSISAISQDANQAARANTNFPVTQSGVVPVTAHLNSSDKNAVAPSAKG